MKTISQSACRRLAAIALLATALGGCNTLDRLSKVGEQPPVSPIENPTHEPTYRPVSMPMPTPVAAHTHPNSLWRTGSRAFFKDLRANEVGDIVTVVVDVQDTAELDNATTRTRTADESAAASALLGYQAALNSILPEAINPANLLNIDSNTSTTGTGQIGREEVIETQIAAVVTQILPNGNLVIHGRQEIRVNYEVREIQVAGIIRPQDITNANIISYEKIAELRIAYGGRGHISDLQQPRYGNQLIDIIFPF